MQVNSAQATRQPHTVFFYYLFNLPRWWECDHLLTARVLWHRKWLPGLEFKGSRVLCLSRILPQYSKMQDGGTIWGNGLYILCLLALTKSILILKMTLIGVGFGLLLCIVPFCCINMEHISGYVFYTLKQNWTNHRKKKMKIMFVSSQSQYWPYERRSSYTQVYREVWWI